MKILISAIGKAKASPEQQLYNEYIKRMSWPVQCREFDVKLQDINQRKQREGGELLAACAGYERIIALDETGKTLSSREFAGEMMGWQQQGFSSFAFVIGGSDGLDAPVKKAAHLVWSFGRVTYPHMLMRALLAEQLYRTQTIILGHPYHK
ncbi:MAG: 23S rRNA (pseudouridine(1915)-N(3))-methyltransferase RlmH [Alphaproteobacteria bacterium]|nr:23S rRNA (pseudouridine(1915)-N(3))-methyltransferase RlmH [Alphaproteobacteria bacterium]